MSLWRRLVITMLVIAPLLWLSAAGVALWRVHDEIDELYDAQQALFARQMLALDIGDDVRPVPSGRRGGRYARHDDIVFIMWNRQGEILLRDAGRLDFPFRPDLKGFQDVRTPRGVWRVFYRTSEDGDRIVAVGQKEAMRHETARDVVQSQLLVWLLPLPFLLLFLILAVRRALRPLHAVGEALAHRPLDDATPIDAAVPAELLPFIAALNRLFARMSDQLERERRFTADAAHELRSPLAGLKVQAEVAQMAEDPDVRDHALAQLGLGIDRATRLVEQMLALSRLDRHAALDGMAQVDWLSVTEAALADVAPLAAERQSRVTCRCEVSADAVLPLAGDPVLLALLVRNLLDNALRYSPPGSTVQLVLGASSVRVVDSGPGIHPEWRERVRERFVRPPGQEMPGSGLGLAIVDQVARLHGLALVLGAAEGGGLEARLQRGWS